MTNETDTFRTDNAGGSGDTGRPCNRLLVDEVKTAKCTCGWRTPGSKHMASCPAFTLTMLVPNSEMLRANPHIRLDLGRDYVASVKTAKEAIALADRLKISYFELDGIFFGRTNRGWNKVTG